MIKTTPCKSRVIISFKQFKFNDSLIPLEFVKSLSETTLIQLGNCLILIKLVIISEICYDLIKQVVETNEYALPINM